MGTARLRVRLSDPPAPFVTSADHVARVTFVELDGDEPVVEVVGAHYRVVVAVWPTRPTGLVDLAAVHQRGVRVVPWDMEPADLGRLRALHRAAWDLRVHDVLVVGGRSPRLDPTARSLRDSPHLPKLDDDALAVIAGRS